MHTEGQGTVHSGGEALLQRTDQEGGREMGTRGKRGHGNKSGPAIPLPRSRPLKAADTPEEATRGWGLCSFTQRLSLEYLLCAGPVQMLRGNSEQDPVPNSKDLAFYRGKQTLIRETREPL